MVSRIAIMLVVMFAVVGDLPAQMPSDTAQPKLPITLMPDPHRCSDLVELEQLPYDAQNDTMSFPIDPRGIDLLLGYYAIEGWLRGYFTGLNIATYSRTGGDITKGTKPRDWMIYIFNYCKQNPWKELTDASAALYTKLSGNPVYQLPGSSNEQRE